ncbi:MAG: hypothetical protein WKF73_07930 [Nocardioidaceae bacterium]
MADTVVIMRAGKVVAAMPAAGATEQSLATMMVGREVGFEVIKDVAQPGDVVLSVRDLQVADDREHATVRGLDLTVRAGEILGIAGVEGNGQRELVEALAGMRIPACRDGRDPGPGHDPVVTPRGRDRSVSGMFPRTAASTASSAPTRSPTTSS